LMNNFEITSIKDLVKLHNSSKLVTILNTLKIKEEDQLNLTKHALLETSNLWKICKIFENEVTFLHKLGEGQFGEVWSGELNRNKRCIPIALKTIEMSDLQEFSQLLKEIDLLSQMNSHPNITEFKGILQKETKNIYCNGIDERWFLERLHFKETK